jgi:hypothetical protein
MIGVFGGRFTHGAVLGFIDFQNFLRFWPKGFYPFAAMNKRLNI